MSALQKKLWFNDEVIAVFKDVSGFRDVAMVGSGKAVPAVDGSTCALEEALSQAKCAVGESFGCFDNGTMWADAGCRGVFTCNGQSHVVCDTMGHGKHLCPCKPGPIPPPGPPHPRPGRSGDTQVWARPTSDGGAAIALHNGFDDTAHNITVDFSTVPKRTWSKTTKLNVRDLWEKADVGATTGSYTATVRPHSTVMLKLTTPPTA